MASKEQGGRVQPVGTPSKASSNVVYKPAKLGASYGTPTNSYKRGKDQKVGS